MFRRQALSHSRLVNRSVQVYTFTSRNQVQFPLSILRPYSSKMSPPSSSIPIFVAGKSTDIGRQVQQALLPDYDVVHMVTSTESLIQQLPLLLRGDQAGDETGLGSNLARPADQQRLPKYIVIGGGFTPENYQEMIDSVDLSAGGKIAEGDWARWVKIGPKKPGDKGPVLPPGQAPSIEYIINGSRKALEEARAEAGDI